MDIEAYTNKYLAQYDGTKPGWFERELVAARREAVIESLRRHPHARILEIGCGLEPLFLHWHEFEHMTIVEPSVEFCNIAARNAPDNVSIITGFFEEVSDQLDSNFDFVVISSLLHEVSNPARLLQSVKTVCNSSTVIHVNVSNAASFHRLLAFESGLIGSIFEQSSMEQTFQRNTRFDKTTLSALLLDNGFTPRHSGSYYVKPFSHSQMEQVLEQQIVPRDVLIGMRKMAKYMPDAGAEIFVEASLA